MKQQVRTQVGEVMQMAALGIGVTMVGLVVGAFIMSPTVSREQRFTAMAALGGAAMLVLMLDGARRLWTMIRSHRTRTARAARPATVAPPTIKLGGRSSSRTPRAVQALAAAGAAPAEIAWKTGLPLDAVSMLLEIGPAR